MEESAGKLKTAKERNWPGPAIWATLKQIFLSRNVNFKGDLHAPFALATVVAFLGFSSLKAAHL